MFLAPDRAGARRRAAFLALLGVGLILAPVAFGMFTKAPRGATMLTNFRPFMTTQRLDGFQSDLREVGAAVTQGQRAIADTAQANGTRSHAVATVGPAYGTFARQWQAVDGDMGGMLRTIQTNLPNYQAMAALPSFRLFPWFFVIPGAILLLLGGLTFSGLASWRTLRWLAAALGVALVLAPVGMGLFGRAPKGAQMMATFRTIETSQHLRRIQGYFSEMAVGQGLVQLQLVPGLRHAGLSRAQIDARYPALDALDGHWVHILNDMTPMIAAMSDNIGNYQAIRSLPSFRLFPWFFVLPGLIVIGIALLGGPRRRPAGPPPVFATPLESLNQGVT